jgi:hypothetical protein
MRGDTIELFIWGFQRHFRLGVGSRVTGSLSILGTVVEPVVFLIGILRAGGEGHPICIEPEDGPLTPSDFSGLNSRAGELFELDPDRHFRISDRRLHELRQQRARERAFGSAIAEILERKIGDGIRFYVAHPTLVDEHHVYTAIGIPQEVLDHAPKLSATTSSDGRIPITGSLVQGAVNELLRACTRALRDPDPGSDLNVLGIDPRSVVVGASCRGASLRGRKGVLPTVRR